MGWDMTGLPRYDAAGIQILGKSGGTVNYSSMVYTVPDKRISVAVIASGAESGAMQIALNVLDAVLVGKKLIAKQEKPLSIPPEPQKLPRDHASHGGYYADDTKLGRIVFDEDKNTATLYLFKEQEKTPAVTFIYSNGYYHDTKGNRYYFQQAGGEDYLAASVSAFGIDRIVMQKAKPVENPQRLKIDMDGKVWLRRNVSPSESIPVTRSHFVRSSLYNDLPGYVFFNGFKRIGSPDFAGMPFDSVRDQTELVLFEKDGTAWAWISDMLYSPKEAAVALRTGENSVRIGNDGYSQWLAANENAVLSFTRSQRGRIVVFSPDGTPTYDSARDTGDVYAAKGSYIECAGLADDAFMIKARPATSGEKK